MSSMTVLATQITSISASLLAAGGISSLSLFDVPELQSQPASRSLPQVRWLFSRGSHIFPSAAWLSMAGFLYLAYAALPTAQRSVFQLINVMANSTKVNGNIAAALLAISIAPFTVFVMLPTNFALMKLNEELQGFRSAKSANENAGNSELSQRSAEDSVMSKGETSEFTDLSGPQEETAEQSTPAEDKRTRELLGKFGQLNLARAVLMTAGGILGLVTALAA